MLLKITTLPFPARLKQLRRAAGLTQPALARLLGVTRDTVSRWETGVYSPTWRMVEALAEALGVRPRDFDCDMEEA